MTVPGQDPIEQRGAGATLDGGEELRPLLALRPTWHVIGWWTVAYGLLSWLVEWVGSHFDRAGPIPFMYGLNRFVYAVVWAGAIVVEVLEAMGESLAQGGRPVALAGAVA